MPAVFVTGKIQLFAAVAAASQSLTAILRVEPGGSGLISVKVAVSGRFLPMRRVNEEWEKTGGRKPVAEMRRE